MKLINTCPFHLQNETLSENINLSLKTYGQDAFNEVSSSHAKYLYGYYPIFL
jgi:hypothetical protein